MKVLDYIPNDAEIGVGLALQVRTRGYVFFLPGERHIKDQMKKELFYAGIGGRWSLRKVYWSVEGEKPEKKLEWTSIMRPVIVQCILMPTR